MIYVHYKDWRKPSTKRNPLRSEEAALRMFEGELWSVAFADYGERVSIYKPYKKGTVMDTTVNTITCLSYDMYVACANSATAKGIIKFFSNGKIAKRMHKLPADYEYVDGGAQMIDEFHKSTGGGVLNTPWFSEPLIDAGWFEQAVYNANFTFNKVEEWISKARVYELTDGGAGLSKEEIVLIDIVHQAYGGAFTVIVPDGVVEADISPKAIMEAIHYRPSSVNIRYHLNVSNRPSVYRVMLEAAKVHPELYDIELYDIKEEADITEDILSDFIMRGCIIPLQRAIIVKIQLRNLFKIILMDDKNGNWIPTSICYKDTVPPAGAVPAPDYIRKPRLDAPLIPVRGFRRQNGTYVKGYFRHKKMRQSWYEVD